MGNIQIMHNNEQQCFKTRARLYNRPLVSCVVTFNPPSVILPSELFIGKLCG